MRKTAFILLFVFALALCAPRTPAVAQTFSAHDLIAAVNELRAAQGLAAYEADGDLMAKAQEHSDYQASIGASTHTHSDGGSPASHGVQENIASGSAEGMSAGYVVYTIWSDALHMNTMAGYTTGRVGAGVAVSGGTMYVTLEVRPGPAAAAVEQTAPKQAGNSALAAAPAALQATSTPQNSIITATPQPDGSIIHTVGAGEALWSIAVAYGVTIAEIRALNGMGPETNDIYEGQPLVIRQADPEALTPSPAPTDTLEPTRPATRTPTLRPTATQGTAAAEDGQPTRTPRPTATVARQTAPPWAGLSGTQMLGAILIGIAVVGIIILGFTGFRK